MRIAIASDAHGDLTSLGKLLDGLPKVDAFCFLGDCVSDGEVIEAELARRMPTALFYSVPGNNDWHVPQVRLLTLDWPVGRVMLTHGHAFRVKQTLDLLAEQAAHTGAAAAFFGHTHQAYTGYHQGVLLLNPGAVYARDGHGTYALVDWTADGILPRIHRIK